MISWLSKVYVNLSCTKFKFAELSDLASSIRLDLARSDKRFESLPFEPPSELCISRNTHELSLPDTRLGLSFLDVVKCWWRAVYSHRFGHPHFTSHSIESPGGVTHHLCLAQTKLAKHWLALAHLFAHRPKRKPVLYWRQQDQHWGRPHLFQNHLLRLYLITANKLQTSGISLQGQKRGTQTTWRVGRSGWKSGLQEAGWWTKTREAEAKKMTLSVRVLLMPLTASSHRLQLHCASSQLISATIRAEHSRLQRGFVLHSNIFLNGTYALPNCLSFYS